MKAVIPAAGFGTRFLPLTKAQPKEMLPVVNKPTIQWVVEEAVDAGITDIGIITGKHKQAIENHFNPMEKLEKALLEAEKFTELEKIKRVNQLAKIEFIIQDEQKGLGHAILCAKEFVGNSPFAVLLGDTICTGEPNCTKGLVDLFNKWGSSFFSVEKVSSEETSRYGIVSGVEVEEKIMLVKSLVEKPAPNDSPSLFGIQGRYVFTPDIFSHLSHTSTGFDGEMQLTDAMNSLSKIQKMYSWTFNGKRYDIGTMDDWFRSHLELSLESEYSIFLNETIKKINNE